MTVFLYAALSGILLLALSSRVVNARRTHRVGIGDGNNEELQRAIRVQANFVEYVPMILLLMFFIEYNGHSPQMIHALGATLIVARILHATGLGQSAGVSLPRFIGTLGTWGVLAISSVILLLDSLPSQ